MEIILWRVGCVEAPWSDAKKKLFEEKMNTDIVDTKHICIDFDVEFPQNYVETSEVEELRSILKQVIKEQQKLTWQNRDDRVILDAVELLRNML